MLSHLKKGKWEKKVLRIGLQPACIHPLNKTLLRKTSFKFKFKPTICLLRFAWSRWVLQLTSSSAQMATSSAPNAGLVEYRCDNYCIVIVAILHYNQCRRFKSSFKLMISPGVVVTKKSHRWSYVACALSITETLHKRLSVETEGHLCQQ